MEDSEAERSSLSNLGLILGSTLLIVLSPVGSLVPLTGKNPLLPLALDMASILGSAVMISLLASRPEILASRIFSQKTNLWKDSQLLPQNREALGIFLAVITIFVILSLSFLASIQSVGPTTSPYYDLQVDQDKVGDCIPTSNSPKAGYVAYSCSIENISSYDKTSVNWKTLDDRKNYSRTINFSNDFKLLSPPEPGVWRFDIAVFNETNQQEVKEVSKLDYDGIYVSDWNETSSNYRTVTLLLSGFVLASGLIATFSLISNLNQKTLDGQLKRKCRKASFNALVLLTVIPLFFYTFAFLLISVL